jgi:hypothetical protein
MKIILTHNDQNLGIVRDYSNANRGLVGQMIAELENIKLDLLEIYGELED